MSAATANYQTFTIFGGTNGTRYTVAAGMAQQVGRFQKNQPFEILGYQSFFIGGYDFANLGAATFAPPLGFVLFNVDQPAFSLPSPFSAIGGPNFSNAIVALQATTVYIPSTAGAGAVNRVVGTAQAQLMFPSNGFKIRIEANQVISTFVRLTGTAQTDDATMITTLYVNLLPS